MPFYIRKSISVGPLRFNLSKGGVGVSAGVKGFRIGSGPRGNYIHMGRGGLYYRASFGSRRPSPPPAPRATPNFQTPAAGAEQPIMTDVEVGDVLQFQDASLENIVSQINDKMNLWPLWPFIAFFGALLLIYLGQLQVKDNYLYAIAALTGVGVCFAAYNDKVRKTRRSI